MQRKCPKCGTWNGSEDNCISCGEVLNYSLIRKKEDTKRIEAFSSRPPDWFDKFLHNFKNSKYILIRAVYYMLYSVWFLFALLVSSFLYMVAAGPG